MESGSWGAPRHRAPRSNPTPPSSPAPGSTVATAPRTNAVLYGPRRRLKGGATSSTLAVPDSNSYSNGLNTNRSLRSTSVTRGRDPRGQARASRRTAV
jgi:hypothetical protein